MKYGHNGVYIINYIIVLRYYLGTYPDNFNNESFCQDCLQ